MKQKILKPTSSYFLSQTFWRILRNIIGKNYWTFFYKLSQKIKIRTKLSELRKENLSLKSNLNYPLYKQQDKKEIKNFSYYLKKHNSSKPHGDYRDYLDKIFFNLKKEVKTILELGISQGAGILSLKDYFYNSYLWGIDIDKNTFLKDKQIVKCDLADQLKIDSLKESAKKFNTKFDLVVDDGWHHPESQINSMIAFLPYLNHNGTYIVEDIVHKDYFKYFQVVKKNLEEKKFQVEYKKFNIKGSDISSELAYLIIRRKN